MSVENIYIYIRRPAPIQSENLIYTKGGVPIKTDFYPQIGERGDGVFKKEDDQEDRGGCSPRVYNKISNNININVQKVDTLRGLRSGKVNKDFLFILMNLVYNFLGLFKYIFGRI